MERVVPHLLDRVYQSRRQSSRLSLVGANRLSGGGGGGGSLKLSTKAAPFKRVSLLIGGRASMLIGRGRTPLGAGPDVYLKSKEPNKGFFRTKLT